MVEAEAEGISDEVDIFLEVLMIHFLKQKEVFANLMRKVNVLIVNLQIVLVYYVPLPNSFVSGKSHHLFNYSEELQLVLRDVGKLKFVLDIVSVDQRRLFLKV